MLWLFAPVAATASEPLRYGYEVLEKRPHPRGNFVQGLQLYGDSLYVSTGQYGESKLLEYRFSDMQPLRESRLPDTLFGEGTTRLGDRLYQLTWRAGRILVYGAENFELLEVGEIPTQGWGLTDNGSELIYSDGSDKLYVLAPDTLEREREVAVTYREQPLGRLNELEWIDGQVWANVWQTNYLVRIDPASGAVTAVADLGGLLDPDEIRPDTDVLNGIAWAGVDGELWVTGKRWPWLFRVRLRELTPGEKAGQ